MMNSALFDIVVPSLKAFFKEALTRARFDRTLLGADACNIRRRFRSSVCTGRPGPQAVWAAGAQGRSHHQSPPTSSTELLRPGSARSVSDRRVFLFTCIFSELQVRRPAWVACCMVHYNVIVSCCLFPSGSGLFCLLSSGFRRKIMNFCHIISNDKKLDEYDTRNAYFCLVGRLFRHFRKIQRRLSVSAADFAGKSYICTYENNSYSYPLCAVFSNDALALSPAFQCGPYPHIQGVVTLAVYDFA